jgi:hypothetical protein
MYQLGLYYEEELMTDSVFSGGYREAPGRPEFPRLHSHAFLFAGALQIRRYQGIAAKRYGVTLNALALKRSDFCIVGGNSDISGTFFDQFVSYHQAANIRCPGTNFK